MSTKLLRLYDKAPAESLAALMVGAALRGETDEIKALWSAAIKDGNSPRYERYRRRRESLILVTMLWANECVAIQANMMALRACIVSGDLPGNEILALDALFRAYRGKLAALHAAMAEFAEETGIDLDTIKPLAAVELVASDDGPVPAKSAVDALLEQFRSLVC